MTPLYILLLYNTDICIITYSRVIAIEKTIDQKENVVGFLEVGTLPAPILTSKSKHQNMFLITRVTYQSFFSLNVKDVEGINVQVREEKPYFGNVAVRYDIYHTHTHTHPIPRPQGPRKPP